MSHELSIADLNKDFSIKGETRHVLDHIDLDIRAGEFFGHRGPLRLRQVHAAQDHRRTRASHDGYRRARRQACDRPRPDEP